MKKSNSSLIGKLKRYSLMVSPVVFKAGFASGQIIYKDVNPDLDISAGAGASAITPLDINNDGVFDLAFRVDHSEVYGSGSNTLINFAGVKFYDSHVGNQLLGYANSGYPFKYPSALNLGASVGPAQNFVSQFSGYATLFYQRAGASLYGQWGEGTDKYLGFALAGNNGPHYGWIRMDVFSNPPEIIIKDYAYNAEANQPIIAGQTSSGACVDIYEPNDQMSEATEIVPDVILSASIGSASDHDWYAFNVIPAENNLQIVLSDLPANYNIALFKGSTLIARSNNKGKANDSIVIDNASADKYRLMVTSANGKYSNSQCYTLSIATSNSPFKINPQQNDYAMRLFPNPADGEINIDLSQSNIAPSAIQVFDQLGRVIYRRETDAGSSSVVTLNTSDWLAGIYFITVISDTAITVRKVSVSH